MRRRVHADLIAHASVSQRRDVEFVRGEVRSADPLLGEDEVAVTAQAVLEDLFGLGVLEPLLSDPDTTEVMVNGPGEVWVERFGGLERAGVTVDASVIDLVIERVVTPLGLRVDRTAPFVDARLPDGSRVNVAVPPIALDGPYVTIRRFRSTPFGLEAFADAPVVGLLREAVEQRRSIIVSGGTGAGKTSLLAALGSVIPSHERVITIEDAAELCLPGHHVVRFESRPANADGVGEVTIRSLVRNALRMRPDRLIVGEVRGAEAFDMVQALNTGHAGSLSTCHANSAADAARRLEIMAMMSGVGLPADIVREHVLSGVDYVVHVERAEGGRRRVASVLELNQSGSRWIVGQGRATGSTA